MYFRVAVQVINDTGHHIDCNSSAERLQNGTLVGIKTPFRTCLAQTMRIYDISIEFQTNNIPVFCN